MNWLFVSVTECQVTPTGTTWHNMGSLLRGMVRVQMKIFGETHPPFELDNPLKNIIFSGLSKWGVDKR